MARASALKVVVSEPAAPTFASVMEALSANYQAALPFKAKLKPLEDEAKTLKESAITLMDEQGLKKTSTKTATISITELERVVIDDVELMLKALKREGWLHMITLNVAQAKEYSEKKGKEIPGTHVATASRFIKLSGIKQV
jgi:hypothetical protein